MPLTRDEDFIDLFTQTRNDSVASMEEVYGEVKETHVDARDVQKRDVQEKEIKERYVLEEEVEVREVEEEEVKGKYVEEEEVEGRYVKEEEVEGIEVREEEVEEREVRARMIPLGPGSYNFHREKKRTPSERIRKLKLRKMVEDADGGSSSKSPWVLD
ncbi:unnamed protein product [Lactuca saligna]|uniref:Uncharacterized protein n=1 Tax=Lactuca saligna TaxID=75948 RepID=A0AA35VZC0_LACSI|nr:unnamed protein product [Lactuca saligna]